MNMEKISPAITIAMEMGNRMEIGIPKRASPVDSSIIINGMIAAINGTDAINCFALRFLKLSMTS